jgi:hypothetical protein
MRMMTGGRRVREAALYGNMKQRVRNETVRT